MHPSPAYLTFCGKFLTIIRGNITGLLERIGYLMLVTFRVVYPFFGAACRVDSYNAIGTQTGLAQLLCDSACFTHLVEETFALLITTHCRPSPGWFPYRRHQRSNYESSGADSF